MPTGISIHLGLNRIDPKHYGINGVLRAGENDAKEMESIARAKGFDTTIHLTEDATSDCLLSFLDDAAGKLIAGDTLLVTFAGHGAQVLDLNFDEQPGVLDDTLCTFDRMVVDDELAVAWSRFAAGVRIIFVVDSCHSATMATMLAFLASQRDGKLFNPFATYGSPAWHQRSGLRFPVDRTLPLETVLDVNRKHRLLYAKIQKTTAPAEKVDIAASVITLAACKDRETARDGEVNGVFTQALLDVWDGGKFHGTYRDFHFQIKGKIKGQHPSYLLIGTPNAAFEGEDPFTIASGKGP